MNNKNLLKLLALTTVVANISMVSFEAYANGSKSSGTGGSGAKRSFLGEVLSSSAKVFGFFGQKTTEAVDLDANKGPSADAENNDPNTDHDAISSASESSKGSNAPQLDNIRLNSGDGVEFNAQNSDNSSEASSNGSSFEDNDATSEVDATDDTSVVTTLAPTSSESTTESIPTSNISSTSHKNASHHHHHVTDLSSEVHSSVAGAIHDRMNSVNSPVHSTVGISSGDESMLRGVWTSASFGRANQGASKAGKDTSGNNITSKGYKSNVTGLTIGADADINDTNIIGAAISYVQGNIKSKNDTTHKSKLNTYVFSLYSQSKFDNLVWSNSASAGFGKVKGKRSELGEAIKSKANLSSYQLETNLGYAILASTDANLYITPNAGLRYESHKVGSYKETGGTQGQNLKVSGASNATLTGIAGVNIASKFKVSGDVVLAPSLNLSVEKALSGKNKAVSTQVIAGGDSFTVKSNKINTAPSFIVGPSLSAHYNNIELTAGYNFTTQKKYQSQQGNLKLRISL